MKKMFLMALLVCTGMAQAGQMPYANGTNLTLTNVSAVYSGAAIHVQNSKRIKGHAEFAQKGTLNITGNVKHGIKTGEYFTIKNSVINILGAAGDGINCSSDMTITGGTIIAVGNLEGGAQISGGTNVTLSNYSSGGGFGWKKNSFFTKLSCICLRMWDFFVILHSQIFL